MVAVLLAVLSILFFGTLYAITGLQFIIQPFVQVRSRYKMVMREWLNSTLQMIGGFIHPGKPMANMYFVLFSYSKVDFCTGIMLPLSVLARFGQSSVASLA